MMESCNFDVNRILDKYPILFSIKRTIQLREDSFIQNCISKINETIGIKNNDKFTYTSRNIDNDLKEVIVYLNKEKYDSIKISLNDGKIIQ